jgi:hypothetical protein
MITTGSVRGKCSALQAGQTRFQPPSATRLGSPQLAMLAPPLEHGLGGGQDAGVGGGQRERHPAQVLETAEPLQRPLRRIGAAFQVDGEDGSLLPQPHEQQPLRPAGQLLGHAGAQIGDMGALLAILDQRAAVP